MEAKYIVDSGLSSKEFKYQYIEEITNLQNDINCIVVESLDPDFTLLLNSIDVIITKKGSKLAHLAIVAREYGKTIILCEELFKSKIDKKGTLKINSTNGGVEIEVK